jgi:hypothetical protein
MPIFDSQDRDADGSWIVRTPRSPGAWVGVVVIVVFAVFMFQGMAVARHPPGTGAVVFLVLFLLFFLYTLLLAAVNRATLRIGREVFTIRYGPLPQSSGATIPTAQIEGFKYVRHHRRKTGTFWVIVALRTDGKEVQLPMSYRSTDLADGAVQTLSGMLSEMRSPPA